MNSANDSLETIRSKIDKLDEQIMPLLFERLQLVLHAKQYKQRLTDSVREQFILANIVERHKQQINHNAFAVYVQNIYHEIFRNSKIMLRRANRHGNHRPNQ